MENWKIRVMMMSREKSGERHPANHPAECLSTSQE